MEADFEGPESLGWGGVCVGGGDGRVEGSSKVRTPKTLPTETQKCADTSVEPLASVFLNCQG